MGFIRLFQRPSDYNHEANHETGSEAEISQRSEFTGAMYPGGHEIPVFAGYIPNPARNNGADIEPIPITPVRKQNWPEMQIQLNQGWQSTNYGKKMSYDTYLRLLTDSANKGRNYLLPSRGGNLHRSAAPGNVQSMVDTTAGSQPTTPGGPGFIASGVDLSGRNFYG
jgi:hypothetical protein